MSKKDIIVQELESVPEKEFDALLGFIHSLKSGSRPRSRPPGQICKRGCRSPAFSILRPIPDEAAPCTGSCDPERRRHHTLPDYQPGQVRRILRRA